MKTRLEFKFKLPLTLKRKSKWVVAACPVLDIVSQGGTDDEAIKNLSEAVSLFRLSCFERGILDEVLKGCGFSANYQSDPFASSGNIQSKKNEPIFMEVPVPMYFNNETRCHA